MTRRAQARDPLPVPGNTASCLSFTTLSDSEIIDRTSGLGISLGKSHDLKRISVNLLKSTELERAATIIRKDVVPS